MIKPASNVNSENKKAEIILINELGWILFKLIEWNVFFFPPFKNLKKAAIIKTKWQTKLIIEIKSKSWQELYGYQVLPKLVHKYVFYLNLKCLNGLHFEIRWPSKLSDELVWAFNKDFIHIKFHSNQLINMIFIFIF